MSVRVHGVWDGRLYGAEGRTIVVESSPGSGIFLPRGTVPTRTSITTPTEYLMRGQIPRMLLERVVGSFPSLTVRHIEESTFIGTTRHAIWRSTDGGYTWHQCGRLPGSSPPFGVLSTAIEWTGETLYLGEYPQAPERPPAILRSRDRGQRWDRLPISGVRHIHAIQCDPYSGDLWITTGDQDDECVIGRLRDGELVPVGSGSQRWRAVELAFTPDTILWGMDCPYARKNYVFRLDREHLDKCPVPQIVYSLDASVFYAKTCTAGDHQWVVLSTATESGFDSTAPNRQGPGTDCTRVVVSSSASAFTEWHELRRYRQRRSLSGFIPGTFLPRANAYVYLTVSEGSTLYLNPFNTTQTTPIERISLLGLPR